MSNEEYLRLAIALAITTLVSSWVMDSYHGIMRRGHLLEFRNVIGFDTVTIALLVCMLFVLKYSATYSRTVVILVWLLAMPVLTMLRIIAKQVSKNRRDEINKRQLLLVTTADNAAKSIDAITNSDAADYTYNGVVILNGNYESLTLEIPVLADSQTLLDYINENVVDGIYVDECAAEYFTGKMQDTCIDMGVTVHIELGNVKRMRNQTVEQFGDAVVLTSAMKIVNSRQVVAKRIIDIAGGIVGSLITIVILIFVTPVIKVQSPGPVIFKQKRVGKSGRVFTIYKIRTMYTDAEERKKELMEQNKMQGLMFKVDNDPRIYPFGQFLRNTSLDEMPQFFNVLKGDMSLVGTRPPTLDEYEQYEYKHQKRLSIKPGITGLWQTSGRSEITDFDEIVKLDAEYITTWRVLSDIKIIWKTIVVVLNRGGAQ